MAEEQSLARRYCAVLEELQKETLQYSQQVQEAPPYHDDEINTFPQRDIHNDYLDRQGCFLGPEVVPEQGNGNMESAQAPPCEISPDGSYDMSAWGTFDSLASVTFFCIMPQGHVLD